MNMPGLIRLPLITLALFSLFFTPTPVSGEWDTFHGDPARTGYSGASYISGDVLWTENIDNGYIDTSPIINGDRVYLISAGDGGADAVIHCIDRETGDYIWNTTIPGKTYQLSTPVFAKGRLYFGSSSGWMYCLVADSGDIRWERPLDSSYDGITSSPAFDEPSGDLYVGTGDGILYNLEIGTGDTVWSFDTGARIYFSSPAVYGETVYIGNDDGILFAVQEGDSIWSYETDDRIRSSAAVSEDGTVYFTSEDGYLRSLTSDGELNWEANIGRSISTPALGDNMVVVGSDTGLYAYDLGGEHLFHIDTDNPVETSPTITDYQIFSATSSTPSELMATDLQGDLIWAYPLEEHVLSSPGLAAGNLFIASDSGMVWCFYSTSPESMNITIEPLSEIPEGTRTIFLNGSVDYDTGRPASGVDVEIFLLNDQVRGRTTANGSFSLNLTMTVDSGIHPVIISVNDGSIAAKVQVNLTVIDDDEEESDSGFYDNFLPSTPPAHFITCFMIAFLVRYLRGCDRSPRL